MIEAVEEWLCGCLGVMKIPLAYVIRPEEAVKPEAEDPHILYTSVEKELSVVHQFSYQMGIIHRTS